MTITKISAQVKNPDRVSIYIDGVYSLSLNLDQLLVEKLKFGLELDEVGRVGESIIVLPDSNRLAWGGRIDQNRVAVKAHHI